jgi:hypothetical protein
LADLHHRRNTLVIATRQPSTLEDFRRNSLHVENSVLRLILRRASSLVRLPEEQGIVLTDDRAPIERLTDLLVAREIMRHRK